MKFSDKIMSSLTVLCPNGHRVKVSTNPNMSLQAVLETACAKKGFNASNHVLEFHRKKLDLSSSIRFSGSMILIIFFYILSMFCQEFRTMRPLRCLS